MKRTPLNRRKPLRNRAPKRTPKLTVDARTLWRESVLKASGQRCAAGPSNCSGPLQCHHVLPKRVLRREGFEDRFWATENGLALCEFHHMSHEARSIPIAASLLPHEAWNFAQELGLDWWLERFYGAEDEAAA